MPTESAAHRLIPHLRRAALAKADDLSDAQLFAAFVARQDEAAFAALVRRHGPTVLGVCRRVVGDVHLAEDAFQATFLVLARRAATVRPRDLGAWLYGVAYRTALKARGAAARRRAREHQVEAMPHPTVSPAPADAWADLQPVLDEELARLPDKYRGPLVLCDLGGRPQRTAARDLGLPPATLANRLAAGRKLLAKRLTERGVVLSAGAVAAALGWHAATQAVSPRLSAATVKLACGSAIGAPAGLPPQVVELSEGVMRMFLVSKLKAVAAGGLSVLILLAGLGLVTQSDVRANPDSPAPPTKAMKDPRPAQEPDDLIYLRRVSLDLRGTSPSGLEVHYFLADKDGNKRGKVVEWMLPDHEKRPVHAGCLACHRDPHVPVVKDLPILGRLFLPEGTSAEARIEQYEKAFRAQTKFHEWEQALKAFDEANAEKAQAEQQVEKDPGEGPKANLIQARVRYQKAVGDVQNLQGLDPKARTVLDPDPRVQQANRPKVVGLEGGPAQRGNVTVTKPKAPAASKAVDGFVLDRLRYYRAGQVAGVSDAEFLRQLSLDVRGVPPTKVEENYFLADKDPKKREKLVELLAPAEKPAKTGNKQVDDFLADPEVAKRYAEWRKAKLEAEAREREKQARLVQQQAALAALARANQQLADQQLLQKARLLKQQGQPDSLAALVKSLQNEKRSDDQTLDAVFLATVARFPTDAEKKLVLEVVRGQADKRAAWDGVAQALSGTPEAKAHADGLTRRASKK
jgi:RNA polymerase sigma factor (sigma-70 family)